MLTYITAFIFYTLAMVGVLLIGYVVYKKTALTSKNNNKGMIKVLDTLSISPRKILMVVKINNEKFLIASGAEHTTFLAKLEQNEKINKEIIEKAAKAEKIEQKKNIEKKIIQETEDSIEESFQSQFRELYSKEEIKNEAIHKERPDRKELIRRLLEDLNETKAKK